MIKVNRKYYLIFICLLMIVIGACSRKVNNASTNEVVEQEKKWLTKTNLTTKERVTLLISEMTLEEKAGQMLQGGRDIVDNFAVTKYGLGSVLSGGGSFPGNNTVNDWQNMILNYQKAAMKTDKQIPFLYGIDAVHGVALVKNAVVYPHNIGLGAANDEQLMYEMGGAVAEEMKLLGVLWNFSPCVAISGDPRWGRTYECYSSDASLVTALADAYMKGQKDHGVVATAKHYVADGSTMFGTGEGDFLIDRGDVVKTEEELRNSDLVPYKKLVDSGVKIIMASFSSYQGVKLHEHKYLLTDVLKEEMGFGGFVVSDWEAVNGLSGSSYDEKIALAINAGVDMLMEPFSYEEAISGIIRGVKNDVIPMSRIDDAVNRILTVKFDMGLFDDPYMEKITYENKEVGSNKYRELAKELVEKSLVLLKNENDILPLKKGQKILVIGPAADNMGLQCGGWGLTWQGNLDAFGNKITKGTTIFEGLEDYEKKMDIEFITDRSRANEADMCILAIGEIPYAEYEGDTKDLSIVGELAHPDNEEAIEYATSLNIPTVTLLVTGRNTIITEYMNDWDGIVMCYLPGSEGDGVASVLVGEKPFHGKLSMPYYKKVEDIGKDNIELLYEFGYGLTY